MLEAISDFLKTIGDGIVSLVEGIGSLLTFLDSMIDDLVYVVLLLEDVGSGIVNWFTWLPPLVVSTLVVLVSLSIIFRVLGRE